MNCNFMRIPISLVCVITVQAEFVPFFIVLDTVGPGAERLERCCSTMNVAGAFENLGNAYFPVVNDRIKPRLYGGESKMGLYARFRVSGATTSSAFFSATEEVTSLTSGCKSNEAAQAYTKYEIVFGAPLLCVGPLKPGHDYDLSIVRVYKQECDWNPPCEPLNEAAMTTDEFVPFELLDVTNYKPSLRLSMCCQDREKFGLTRAKAVFSNVEEMTKVFRQLQKVHTVNFAMHTDVESNLNAFLNVVFMTGDGEKVESSDCFVGAAAEKLSNFVGPTYCVSQGGSNRHFDFDTKEKMYDKFGWPPTTTEISTSTTVTSTSTTVTSSSTTEISSPTSTITALTEDKNTPSKVRPLVDKYCSSPACTRNPPSKCCSFCRTKN